MTTTPSTRPTELRSQGFHYMKQCDSFVVLFVPQWLILVSSSQSWQLYLKINHEAADCRSCLIWNGGGCASQDRYLMYWLGWIHSAADRNTLSGQVTSHHNATPTRDCTTSSEVLTLRLSVLLGSNCSRIQGRCLIFYIEWWRFAFTRASSQTFCLHYCAECR